MQTAIYWTVERMSCKPQQASYTDVVITANWRCSGVNGDFYADSYGTCSFPAPDGSFTPYANLTEAQVLSWCWANGVNKVATEAYVEQKMQDQINPPVVELPLPWVTP